MDDILAWIGDREGPQALLLMAALSAVEYLFPPFPGDAAVVAGAFLVATRGWSLLPVFGATTAGSLVGAFGHWALGRWLASRRWEPASPRGRRIKAATLAVVADFERRGAAYLAVNRFLPGVRSFFFLAAGWARIPLAKTLAWGAVSALAWNVLLVGAAFLAGNHWDTLASLTRTYSIAAWVVLAVVAFVVWRRRRGKSW
jgi:membrane-associated protein